jgi:hypothetical protein
MLTKRTVKNQLTLPKEIIGHFDGVEYFDAVLDQGRIVLTPVKITPVYDNLEAIRDKLEKLGIQEDDVADAVRWARGKKQL